MRKPFDAELFLDNDQRARAAVLTHLHLQGIHAAENPDLYGPDLVVYSGYRPAYYLEVEVKRVWKSGDGTFPWETVQLPERKAKFLRKRLLIEFWVLDNSCNYAVVIPESTLSSSLLAEVPTSMGIEGEKFFQIPLEQCNVVELVH